MEDLDDRLELYPSRAATAPTAPLPVWLHGIKPRAAGFAGLAPREIIQALLIRHDPGAGMGRHKDRPVFDHVLQLSIYHLLAKAQPGRRGSCLFLRA